MKVNGLPAAAVAESALVITGAVQLADCTVIVDGAEVTTVL
jgi:hypothetical protein